MALSLTPPRGTEFGQSVHSAKRGWGISLVGKTEAEQMIRQCRDLLNSEQVQDAILPAAQLVRDVAKRLVNIGPGKRTDGDKRRHLRDLIFATKGRRRNSGMIEAASTWLSKWSDSPGQGPSVIAGVDLKQAPHAHLVEFGHAQVVGGQLHPSGKRRKKGVQPGTVVGYVEPHPFLRPAVAACRRMIVTIIESALIRLLAPYSSK